MPEKRLKTASSKRVIPVHPTLKACGFLDYVARIRSQGCTNLFPDLKPYKGKRTFKFSRDFGRLKRRLGFNQHLLDFHAFRHGFKDAVRRATQSDEIRNQLMGHAASNTGSRYGSGDDLVTLAEVMARVDYPGLDLTHLMQPALKV